MIKLLSKILARIIAPAMWIEYEIKRREAND